MKILQGDENIRLVAASVCEQAKEQAIRPNERKAGVKPIFNYSKEKIKIPADVSIYRKKSRKILITSPELADYMLFYLYEKNIHKHFQEFGKANGKMIRQLLIVLSYILITVGPGLMEYLLKGFLKALFTNQWKRLITDIGALT